MEGGSFRELSQEEAMEATARAYSNSKASDRRRAAAKKEPSNPSSKKRTRDSQAATMIAPPSKKQAAPRYTPKEENAIAEFVMKMRTLDAASGTTTSIPFNRLNLPGRTEVGIASHWRRNMIYRLQDDGKLLDIDSPRTQLANMLRNDSEEAKKYLESIPKEKRIQGNDERFKGTNARDMGCHEVDYKPKDESIGGYTTKAYKTESHGTIDGIKLHQAACISEHGPKPPPKSSAYEDQYTASHICQNSYCVNPKHLCWETFKDNLSRKGCFGYCRFVKSGQSKLVELNECTHNCRCKNFITVKL